MKVRQSPYRKILVTIGSMWVITIVLLSSCAPENQDQQSTSQPELPATATAVNITIPETSIAKVPGSLIREILASPGDFAGKQVNIAGYYRGWDLLMEVSNSSPVTRSDWVIADESGAMYVTGVAPEGLDPSSKDVVWTVVHLVAIVEFNEKGIYLKAQSVDVISPD